MAEGISVVQATAPKYLKGFADQTIRNRLWLSLLRRYGRIKTGESGTTCTWDAQFSEPPVRSYGDAGDQTFAEHDAYRQLTLDWRGYTATDRLTEKKYLMNKGPVQIVNLYDQKIKNLEKAINHTFGAELYIDGNASGNENRLHGITSFTGDDGATVAGDLIARPSDTYAGQSTVPATLGGNWSSDLSTSPNAVLATDFPNGSGDVEYSWMSPILLNYSSTSWGTSSTTWEDNCERTLRQAVIWCKHLGGLDMGPYCHLLAADMFTAFQNFQSARNRINVPHKEADDLGFGDALNHDGTVVKHEYDCPAATGHGIIPGEMCLKSIDDVLFRPRGPDWDPKSKSYLFQIGMFGNLHFNPPRFARYAAYA